ncbi:MAG: TRAP transporter small permease subunit [Synergistaceae bacterium]|jgi:TRAP-type C4-dicarboxylate transport system permease small subunit|nr:TRAP transporter small permease subunit [Synergistaceae bacterium]
MKRLFLLVWRVLDWVQQIIMVTTSVAIVLLILVQVVLRYGFMMPLMGVEELACLCGFWLYFTGAANGSRERSHIKADLLNVFIKNERVLYGAKTLVSLVLIVLAGIFTEWTISYFRWSLRSWERSPALSIPMVFAQASLMINAALMFFYFFIEFLDYARQALGYAPFHFTGLQPSSSQSTAQESE